MSTRRSSTAEGDNASIALDVNAPEVEPEDDDSGPSARTQGISSDSANRTTRSESTPPSVTANTPAGVRVSNAGTIEMEVIPNPEALVAATAHTEKDTSELGLRDIAIKLDGGTDDDGAGAGLGRECTLRACT